MQKSIVSLVVVSFIFLGAFTSSGHMASSRSSASFRDTTNSTSLMNDSIGTSMTRTGMYPIDKLIGVLVRNRQGDELGQIKSFVVDGDGRIAFALVTAYRGLFGLGDRVIAVPFAALDLRGVDRRPILDMNKDQFGSAPSFDAGRDLDDSWAENMYRYFGQTPYWSE
jgi:hypothetical protein